MSEGALRWGVIGSGAIAAQFTADLHHTDSGVMVAVGSRTQERADAFGERFGVANRHGSYAQLVADPDVDAVYVATPHPMHRDDTLLALAAAKHVLVEKAFTMTAAQARELVNAARASGLFLMEAMWTRFLPHVRAIRRLVADGSLGEIVTVTADHGQWFQRDGAHRLFAAELGGGALLDLGVYPVSFASMLLGRPDRIEAIVDPAFTGVDGQTSILLGHPDGAQAVLTCTSSAKSSTRAAIVGTEARIEIEGDFYEPAAFSLISRQGDVERIELPCAGRGMWCEADEVARCIRAGETESPEMPLDETVTIMETMERVLAQG